MKKMQVLHIIRDDKFFDLGYPSYETRTDLSNIYCYLSDVKNYKLQNTKYADKVTVVCGTKEIKRFLSNAEYDLVYIHSLHHSQWKYILMIPKDKEIAWWSWGYDIYKGIRGAKPFLKVEVFKPRTQELMEQHQSKLHTIIRKVVPILCLPYFEYRKRQVLKRIDFFQPVLRTEYDMMKKLPSFRAQLFYFMENDMGLFESVKAEKPGDNILFGNSATQTNNHLDVWDYINRPDLDGRTIIVPLSYGDKNYAAQLKGEMLPKSANLHILDDYMAYEDYFSLIGSCSYAVFGMMRQQAIGNVYFCLLSKMKIFLFKESMVYKHFTRMGYKVFAIEDIDKNSFNTRLTETEYAQNMAAYQKEQEQRNHDYAMAWNKIKSNI